RRVENLENRAVAHAERVTEVRLREHALSLAHAEYVLRQAMLEPRQVELGRRVVENVILSREPLEQRAHRHEVRELAPEAQRPAVLLAVVIQVPLVAL